MYYTIKVSLQINREKNLVQVSGNLKKSKSGFPIYNLH